MSRRICIAPQRFSRVARMPDSQDPSAADGSENPPGTAPSPPSGGSLRGFALSHRQETVASELHRLDPQLAGLFRLGLELATRGDTPGLSYLIAEAGRELNVGVTKALAAGAPALSAEQLATIAENDDYRGPIARALRLHPQHPLVSAWAEMNRRFNTEAHLVPYVHPRVRRLRILDALAELPTRSTCSLLRGSGRGRCIVSSRCSRARE